MEINVMYEISVWSMFFFIYCFFGWCFESSYVSLCERKPVNRGFLNGPYCPIYGCGVVIVVAVLTPIKESLFILFLGSMLLTTVLEFLTGFILEKVFHNKWWDYSDKPFNIMGYVCLKFSILWGLACTFIMKVLHPSIYKFITIIPHVLGIILLSIIMTAFFIDLGVTVSTILKFNKRLKLMDEVAQKMHQLSDEIGENIYEGVTTVKEKSEEVQDKAGELRGKFEEKTDAVREAFAENLLESKTEYEHRKEAAKKEYEELTKKYKELITQKNFGFKRLMEAFPDMISRDQNEILKKYKKQFNIRFKREKEDE